MRVFKKIMSLIALSSILLSSNSFVFAQPKEIYISASELDCSKDLNLCGLNLFKKKKKLSQDINQTETYQDKNLLDLSLPEQNTDVLSEPDKNIDVLSESKKDTNILSESYDPNAENVESAKNNMYLLAATPEVPLGRAITLHIDARKIKNLADKDDQCGLRIIDDTEKVQYDTHIRAYKKNSNEFYFQETVQFIPYGVTTPGDYGLKAYIYEINNDDHRRWSDEIIITIIENLNIKHITDSVDMIQEEISSGLEELKAIPGAINILQNEIKELQELIQSQNYHDNYPCGCHDYHDRYSCGCHGRKNQINFID